MTKIMPFHILKIPSAYVKWYVLSNGFERFWTVDERFLNACWTLVNANVLFTQLVLNCNFWSERFSCVILHCFYVLCFFLNIFIFCDGGWKMSLKYFEHLKVMYLIGKRKSDRNGKKCSKALLSIRFQKPSFWEINHVFLFSNLRVYQVCVYFMVCILSMKLADIIPTCWVGGSAHCNNCQG